MIRPLGIVVATIGAGTLLGSPLHKSPLAAEPTHSTMPPDNAKTIPRSQITDILAYVLALNHFPSGRVALGDDGARLRDIKLVRSKP
jgi:hypothetical protein